jgi:hypothetical protein
MMPSGGRFNRGIRWRFRDACGIDQTTNASGWTRAIVSALACFSRLETGGTVAVDYGDRADWVRLESRYAKGRG